jgi:phosphatidylglycerophosphate synthase
MNTNTTETGPRTLAGPSRTPHPLAGGIYSIKPRFQRSLARIEGALVRKGVHPDVITISGLIVCVLGGAALYGARWYPFLLLLVPFAALVRTALNALDGLVARSSGLARPWGEVLNECCDRLADVSLFVGLLFAPGSNAPMGCAALVLMLLSSYVGTVAKAAGGKRQYGGIMGKADRMLYLGVAAPVALLLPGVPVFTYLLAAVTAGLCITIFQRMEAAYNDLQPRS